MKWTIDRDVFLIFHSFDDAVLRRKLRQLLWGYPKLVDAVFTPQLDELRRRVTRQLEKEREERAERAARRKRVSADPKKVEAKIQRRESTAEDRSIDAMEIASTSFTPYVDNTDKSIIGYGGLSESPTKHAGGGSLLEGTGIQEVGIRRDRTEETAHESRKVLQNSSIDGCHIEEQEEQRGHVVNSNSREPHLDAMPTVSNHDEEVSTITSQIKIHPSESESSA